MFTMGNDFAWEGAHEWFKNLDKLVKYVNEKVSIAILSKILDNTSLLHLRTNLVN